MLEKITDRVISRKFGFGLAGLIFYALGATDTIAITTEESFLSGAVSLLGIAGIVLQDLVKAWRA